MAASSSSSAAAEPRLPKHHVFLSFSGETRKKFTSHLYSALSKKYITFKDEANLREGDTISPALLEAIEESEISIIIFSQKYAFSSWCLDELVHILKCREKKAQIILPIFIDIDPWHIQNQEGSYADAFRDHEVHFNMEKVLQWRQALEKAAVISGWDSRNMYEAQIVEKVVERVRKELDSIKSKSSGDFEGLVGIQDRLKDIESFLCSPTVRIIGIWGMGGIGKTKLAKTVFNRFYNDFEESYFTDSVRVNAINNGLENLEKEVYSELLGEKNLNIFKLSDVNDRLSRKRILLVLDDVETPMQLRRLVGEAHRFCPGSKIIVTSRNKLLVDAEYKVEALDFDDARKLFYLNAFGCNSCRRGYEEISGRVVEYTKGHPLALQVLGVNVFGLSESIGDWEKQLEKLERIPNGEIQKVLIRSYTVLDDEEKGLFLDIACFFEGQRSDFVEGIEDKPITGLVNQSLITIKGGEIHMHYLIQLMGRDIVVRSTQKLGERTRLWIAKDVSDVLENNKGTEALEGIYLPWNKEDEEVHLRPDVFEEMRKLRLLKFYDASHYDLWYGKVKFIDGDLKYLPNSLRYLHWEYYPGKSLPTNFKPQYLVELHMPCSKNLQSLPANIGMLYKLKKLDISMCNNLQSLPEYLGSLTSLTELYLRGNIFDRIPASIGRLYKLKKLDISECKNLQSLPELPLFIESVNAKDCSSLKMVSTSRSTLALGRWLDKYDSDNDKGEFSFLNCTKLGEDAINNIFTEFLYKVFCTATTPPEVLVSKAQRVIRELLVCYPTKEIPRWFNNQSEGSSITITLPPNWYNVKTFLGFVVSAVFWVNEITTGSIASINCELHLITNKDRFRVDLFEDYTVKSRLDHIVMWYKYFDHSEANFEKYQEASLEFRSPYGRVERCGVRMFYLKDAVEESNFESWITNDSDEPPPKRTRNL